MKISKILKIGIVFAIFSLSFIQLPFSGVAKDTITKVQFTSNEKTIGCSDSSSDDWSMFHENLTHAGFAQTTPKGNNGPFWNFTTGGAIESSPAVSNGSVYVGSDDGNVYCLNTTTGVLIWEYSTGGQVESSPALSNGFVYIGSDDGNIYCLNATSSDLKWKFQTNDYVQSPAISYGYVYVSSGWRLYCLDKNSGSQSWNCLLPTWTYSSPVISPVPTNFQIYIGCFEGLYSVDGIGISENLSTTGEGVDSSPALAGGYLYVGSNDENIYCVDPWYSSTVWNYTTGGIIISSPAVSNEFVYVGSDDNNTYCLDRTNGDLEWKFTTGGHVTSSPAISNGMVYIGSNDKNLYCLPMITPPSAPQNLTVTIGINQTNLSWKLPQFTGGRAITTYKIYRGLSKNNESYLAAVEGNVLNFNDTIGLTQGKTYFYKVCAINSVGEGSFSADFNITMVNFYNSSSINGMGVGEVVIFTFLAVIYIITYTRKQYGR